jgi:hypothetical protein
MGMFSYICSKTNEQIVSDEAAVVLYYLVNGKIVEVIAGPYNGYGAVEAESQTTHLVANNAGILIPSTPNYLRKFSGQEWTHDEWGAMVKAHFSDNEAFGFHAVKGEYDPEYVPTARSEDDPHQGWVSDDEEEDDSCPDCGELHFCSCDEDDDE